MTDNTITESQRSVLDAIGLLHALNGHAPSLKDIAEVCGLKSTACVKHHVDNLVEAGWITRDPHRPRTIVLRRG